MNPRSFVPRCRGAVSWLPLTALLVAAASPLAAQPSPSPAPTPTPSASADDEAIVLEEFVIETIAAGQAAAIRRQRDADNIRNIVTSDAVGRLPDFSVGEALSRLPGVSVQKDRGEPEFITIRGAAPRLNSVALNGERLPSVADPSEDRNDRSVTLNSVPTALISAIEVSKAVTPDMDADAVGGAVNLTTRSPLDLDRRLLDAKIEWGWNELIDGELFSANVNVGDRFGSRRQFGLLAGASYQYSNRGIHETNFNYGDVTLFGSSPAVTFRGLQELEYRFRLIDRRRQGANLQLDWEARPGHRLFVRGFHNEFRDTEERARLRNRFSTDGRYLAGSGTQPDRGVVDGNRFTRQERKGFKDTQTSQIAAGGTHDFGAGRLDYTLSHTRSEFVTDRVVANFENRLTDFNQRDGVADVRFDATNFEFPEVVLLTPGPSNLAQFVIRSGRGDFTDQDDSSEESDSNASLNYRHTLELAGQEVRLQTGYRGRFKETESVPGAKRYTRNANTPTLSLPAFLNDGEDLVIFDRYPIGRQVNFDTLRSAFFDNTGLWTFDASGNILNNILNTYSGSEDIHAGYLMGTTDLGPVRLVAGLRYERTENDYRAFRRRTGDLALAVDEVTGTSSYDTWFPGVLATWRLSPNVLLRGAYTNTIARPDYKDLAPFVDADIQLDDPALTNVTLRTGNPALQPFESTNYDLSFEWYYNKTGFLSVGYFQKDITNFEFDAFTDVTGTAPPEQTGPIPGAAPLYRVRTTQPVNGPSATLEGWEFALSHKFDGLPQPLGGLGVIANATFIEGESELPPGQSRRTLDLLPGQVDKVLNLQVYWENEVVAIRAAWNYNGVYLEEVGSDAIRDIFVDESETYDLSLEWKFWRGHRAYVELKNLTDEYSERKYQGQREKPTLREEAGRTLLIGLKLEF